MRTLIWKELREHLPLALIALVVSVFVLVPAYRACVVAPDTMVALSQTHRLDPQPLLAGNLLHAAVIFCALFASLLGWRQVRSESHRDLRAFLLHRPLPQARIFIGKTVAGLALYALGAGLPFAILVAVTRIPGNIAAPFEWAMVQPLLGCFLGGSAGYFGGMLTGLWQGRWWASRGLGLGAVIVVMLGVLWLSEFWQALVIIGLVLGLMGYAAWTAFQGQGEDGTATSFGQAVLAVAFLPGAIIAVLLVVFLATPLFAGPVSRSMRVEGHFMAKDGTVYLLAQDVFSSQVQELLHLDRTPVVDPETGRTMDASALANLVAHGVFLQVVGTDNGYERQMYQRAGRYFQPWRLDGGTLWYWKATGDIVGYDLATRRAVARIQPAVPNERFRRPPGIGTLQTWNQPHTLASSHAVYRIDPGSQSATPLFATPAGETIVATAEAARGELARHVVVVTERRIRLLSLEGRVVWELASDAERHGDHRIHVYALDAPGQYCVWIVPTERPDRMPTESTSGQAFWLSEADGLERTIDLPALEWRPYRLSLRDRVLTALMPPAMRTIIPAGHPDDPVPGTLLVAVLCVLVGWGIGHRHGSLPRQQAGWAAFHLLFGLPGLLVSLAVRERPTREPCPQCQRLRPVDHAECPNCGARFAPPQRDGTEIFEPIRPMDSAVRSYGTGDS